MHVAIIMDGNGRWATRQGLPRTAGHRAGAQTVRKIVEVAARSPDVHKLTLYAFSSDNWARPAQEVKSLMALLKRYLNNEMERCYENGVRLKVIGRRDRLSPEIVDLIENAEHVTAGGQQLSLQLAVDYSARASIADAARLYAAQGSKGTEFVDLIARVTHGVRERASVDLLIRTGGERRLSDFLLWECAYAELVFTDTCWPDFDEQDFHAALDDYRQRERRFGGLPQVPSQAQTPASS